jgi:hypothetical protein
VSDLADIPVVDLVEVEPDNDDTQSHECVAAEPADDEEGDN